MTKKDTLDLVANYRAEVKKVVGDHLAGEDLATELDDLFAELGDHVKDDTQINDLEEIDEDQLVEYLKDKGYTVLNFDNLIERSKLDDFLRSEIFPRYNDQKAFL